MALDAVRYIINNGIPGDVIYFADGYVYVAGTQYAASGYIFLSNDASGMQVVSQPTNVSTFEVRCIMPLAKGQQYTIIYGDLYVNVFKFVYAIGG